jgi:hypothetical protein
MVAAQCPRCGVDRGARRDDIVDQDEATPRRRCRTRCPEGALQPVEPLAAGTPGLRGCRAHAAQESSVGEAQLAGGRACNQLGLIESAVPTAVPVQRDSCHDIGLIAQGVGESARQPETQFHRHRSQPGELDRADHPIEGLPI